MKNLLSEHKIGMIKISASVVLAILGLVFSGLSNIAISTLAFFAAYIIIGYEIIFRAIKEVLYGEGISERMLMTVTSVGAFMISEFFEGCAVLILYTVGEIFEDVAKDASKRSIETLANIRPDKARLRNQELVDASSVRVGDIIEVRPGERIALDGTVVDSFGNIDASVITGESVPVAVRNGSEVLAGSLNCDTVIYVDVKREADKSAAQRIIDISKNALERKTKSEKFIKAFAKLYTPIVIALALFIAIVPPIFDGYDFGSWIYKALSMLAISCPCAIVVSVPLAYFCSIGYASKKGILIKGSGVLDMLSKVDTVAFDKTGTITKAKLNVTGIETALGFEKVYLMTCACIAECKSNHPIAVAIIEESKKFNIIAELGENYRETIGDGIECDSRYGHIKAGKKSFANAPREAHGNVHVSVDGKYIGSVILGDDLKPNAKIAFRELRDLNVNKKIILSGDKKSRVRSIAKSVLADDYYGELLPEQKLEIVRMLVDKKAKNSAVAYCGDGINDTPSVAAADVGIAMGALGSDSAVELSDVVVMDDDIAKIPLAIKIAKRTKRTVIGCILMSILVKAVMLVLSALGFVPMIAAIISDVGILIAAIVLALFAGRI